ncbi:hypothetical protein V6N12_058510 [Hibiscus sabdariffa]|uniref:Uncharacterized protein n=1 Tax=Hibiscus sabdariffa TaxID=183260 RepID=A0ABR2EU82_9ROSI
MKHVGEDLQSKDELYGPWMVVESRRGRTSSGASSYKVLPNKKVQQVGSKGSRFSTLENKEVIAKKPADDLPNIITSGGLSKGSDSVEKSLVGESTIAFYDVVPIFPDHEVEIVPHAVAQALNDGKHHELNLRKPAGIRMASQPVLKDWMLRFSKELDAIGETTSEIARDTSKDIDSSSPEDDSTHNAESVIDIGTGVIVLEIVDEVQVYNVVKL